MQELSDEPDLSIAEYDEDIASLSDIDESPIMARRARLASRLAKLEKDNQKFAEVADQLNDMAYAGDFENELGGTHENDRTGQSWGPHYDSQWTEQRNSRSTNRKGPSGSRAYHASKLDEPEHVSQLNFTRPYQEEILRLKEKLARRDEKLKQAIQEIHGLQQRIFTLELGTLERDDREDDISLPPQPSRSSTEKKVLSAASRVVEDSLVAEEHLRSMGAPVVQRPPSIVEARVRRNRRPPFVFGGHTLQTYNLAVPISTGDKTSNRLKRLREEKQFLNEQYKLLLRYGNPRDGHASARLQACLSLIEENEQKIRELCMKNNALQ